MATGGHLEFCIRQQSNKNILSYRMHRLCILELHFYSLKMATSGNLEFQTRPILLPSLLLTYIKLHAKDENNPTRTF